MPGPIARVRATPTRMLLPTVFGLAAYLVTVSLTFGMRPDHLVVAGVALFLCTWSDGARRVFWALLPFLVFGVVYDLSRLATPLVRHLHVHVQEPYLFDRKFFGIPSPSGPLTPAEFFARHHGPAVDFVAGLAYILYVYWPFGFMVYLLLARRDEQGQRLTRRFGWTFCVVNIAGFLTYYLYPAAPPWYTAAHGFGPPDFSVGASPAAAARWDALTGLHYFEAFYQRSAEVFGAIPSLHVSYPLVVFLFARELGKPSLDAVNFCFYLLLCFSAVYLQHHYVLDVLVGSAYAVAGYGVERLVSARLDGPPSPVVVRTTGA